METLARINPRLIYCAISGLARIPPIPAAPPSTRWRKTMSGLMDLTRQDGVPQKPGISSADIFGGLLGLVAVLDALAAPESERRSQVIDISMQDASAWLTLWPQGYPAGARVAVIQCSEGYAAAILDLSASAAGASAQQKRTARFVARAFPRRIRAMPRGERHRCRADSHGQRSGPAREQTQARGLLARALDGLGREWPMILSPIRLSGAPIIVSHAIGPLGEANAQLTARLRSEKRDA